MRDPFSELRSFLRAALVIPLPRDHEESDAAFRHRRVVTLATLAAGAVLLAVALRIRPGDALFYPATLLLALVWTGGALLSGRLYLGRARTRAGGSDALPVVQALALGIGLVLLFLAGSVAVARIPVLREPVETLLDHARFGSLPLVAALTALNGVAEELYFRGAAYAAVGRRHGVLVTTLAYALVTAASGVLLLVFAAACLGLVTGMQRRVTGGVLGPIVTHLTFSMGMLLLLPQALGLFA